MGQLRNHLLANIIEIEHSNRKAQWQRRREFALLSPEPKGEVD
jgi:hypothetical protein